MNPPPSRRSQRLARRNAQNAADSSSRPLHISKANRTTLGIRKKATRRTHQPEPVTSDNPTVLQPIIKFEPIDPPQRPVANRTEDHHDGVQETSSTAPLPNVKVNHHQMAEYLIHSTYQQGSKHTNTQSNGSEIALQSTTVPGGGMSRAPVPTTSRHGQKARPIEQSIAINAARPSQRPRVFPPAPRTVIGGRRAAARMSMQLAPRESRASFDLITPPAPSFPQMPAPETNQRRFEPNFTRVDLATPHGQLKVKYPRVLTQQVFQNTRMWMDVYQNCGYRFQVEAFVDRAGQIPIVIKCGTFATLYQANRVVLQVFSEDSKSLMAERYEKMVFRETNEVPSSGHWTGYCFAVYHPVLRLWAKQEQLWSFRVEATISPRDVSV
ncbi:hypothetical protein BKA67DRAFT_651390 [Truncatella angustata]|uniref:Uncharacterized protein n=1 Tax=Truncatella angustata TaxID=152316 RepID=A0A9P8RM11_9PEZI|nr:uncharacterized protein BKA67DRAFT_651390 [Truncatella angustata]KAH6645700.1 hypothetical protein BKA67DRAFT_651390 [Truncatella angustata]